jgi:hypothetical protein
MIQDEILKRSVSKILQRSERQDLPKIIRSFVDVGVLPQLLNQNNQIVYGRRGTGKTHIFKVLYSELEKDKLNSVLYLDGRTLGSTAQFTDSDIPIKQRCISLFRDVLGEIHNALLDHIVSQPPEKADVAFDALDKLSVVVTEPIKTYLEESYKLKSLDKDGTEASVAASLGRPDFSGKFKINGSHESEQSSSYVVREEDKIIFPALHHLLNDVLDKTNAALYILFDEWSSIPIDLQPYLAEFMKRSFFANPRVIIKIASLEYRSRFTLQHGSTTYGLEVGSDISTAIDIDDYYVFDRNPNNVTDAFSEILFKHIQSEVPEDYLKSKYNVNSGSSLVSKMFTSKATFQELVRASEGVVRDLINIFISAFFDSQRKSRDKIEHPSIVEASRQWFEQDKSQNLDENLRRILEKIVNEVIGQKKARSFLIPRDLEKHPFIQRLFDLRVLHLMKRGYADKDNPGVRYNIYSLDYGTYVDLKHTSKQPDLEFFDDKEESNEFVVPFDDRRSIRRIVLTSDILI